MSNNISDLTEYVFHTHVDIAVRKQLILWSNSQQEVVLVLVPQCPDTKCMEQMKFTKC